MKVRLAKGALWLGTARVLINALAIASTLILARLLTPEDFGLVAIALTLSAIMSSVTELSLGSALVQHRNPDDGHFDTAFTLNVLRACLLGSILASLALPTASLYDEPRLTNIMFALAATTAASGFANTRIVGFTRELIFRQEFMLSVSSKIVAFAVGTSIAYTWQTYWALLAGSAAHQIWYTALSYLIVPHRPRLRLREAGELLSFSVWLSLGQIVQTLNYRFDTLAIGYFIGKPSLGAYTFGDNLAQLPTREATSPIAQTLFPAFSRLADDPTTLREAYRRSQSILLAIVLPVGCGFAVLAEPVVLLTVGEKWRAAIFVIQVLASVFALQTLAAAVHPLAMAMGKTRALFNRDIVLFIFRLPLLIAGLFLGGLNGVVIARFVSGSVLTIVNMALAHRLVNYSVLQQLKHNARPLISAAIMAITISLLRQEFEFVSDTVRRALVLGGLGCVGATVYVGTNFALWMLIGKPDGPETEAVQFVQALARTLGPRKQA